MRLHENKPIYLATAYKQKLLHIENNKYIIKDRKHQAYSKDMFDINRLSL